ncbi:hypothetical protein B0J14DRAFT_612325 [Halenospora varia]|nr:hypothetical protein B0J14DRAFT_612325 [Halenospora varia]
MSVPEIPNFHRLRRSKLRALLCKDLDIRWNMLLKDTAFEDDGKSVTATFVNGQRITGLAFPHPDGLFAVSGLQDAPEVDKPEGWNVFYISWPSSFGQQDEEAAKFRNKERLRQVKELAKGYPEPWKSEFEWVLEDQPAWYFALTAWNLSVLEHQWDTKNGQVALAGLNHSITDAGNLVLLLAEESDIRSAIEKYESEMKSRAGEEV